jgi:threonine dehydrogenase-like Zn-dependent dehydrogenase
MRGLGAPSFAKLFELIVERKIDLSQLVTGRIALSQLGDALSRMDGDQSAGITVVNNLSG